MCKQLTITLRTRLDANSSLWVWLLPLLSKSLLVLLQRLVPNIVSHEALLNSETNLH